MKLQLFRGNGKKDLEKRFTTFSEQLAQAFAQIKTDISEVNNRLETNQSEVERIGQWIEYLNRSNSRITEQNSRILQKYDDLAENHRKLHTSHSELTAEHARTAQIAAGMSENLENNHQRLSSTISAHRESLKSELSGELKSHIEQQKAASEDELRRLKAWVDHLSAHLEAYKGREGSLKHDLDNLEKTWLERYSSLRTSLNGLETENSELKSDVSMMTRQLDDARNQLRSTLADLEHAKSELKNLQDFTKNSVFEAKSELSKEIEALKELAEQAKHSPQKVVQPQPAPIQQPVQPMQQIVRPVQPVVQQVSPAQSPFQRHIMSRVMPNRKGYVLKFIMDLVSESKYSTKEVEEIVVGEKQLCGRTSFYAYLKELKLKGRLNYAEIDERTILVSTDTQKTLTDGLAERIE